MLQSTCRLAICPLAISSFVAASSASDIEATCNSWSPNYTEFGRHSRRSQGWRGHHQIPSIFPENIQLLKGWFRPSYMSQSCVITLNVYVILRTLIICVTAQFCRCRCDAIWVGKESLASMYTANYASKYGLKKC